MPSLASILSAKKEDVPHIYLLHALTGTIAVYPEKLEDMNNFSPELIIAWAQKEVVHLEMMNYEEQLASADEPLQDLS